MRDRAANAEDRLFGCFARAAAAGGRGSPALSAAAVHVGDFGWRRWHCCAVCVADVVDWDWFLVRCCAVGDCAGDCAGDVVACFCDGDAEAVDDLFFFC